jgi:hypothetical protein
MTTKNKKEDEEEESSDGDLTMEEATLKRVRSVTVEAEAAALVEELIMDRVVWSESRSTIEVVKPILAEKFGAAGWDRIEHQALELATKSLCAFYGNSEKIDDAVARALAPDETEETEKIKK